MNSDYTRESPFAYIINIGLHNTGDGPILRLLALSARLPWPESRAGIVAAALRTQGWAKVPHCEFHGNRGCGASLALVMAA